VNEIKDLFVGSWVPVLESVGDIFEGLDGLLKFKLEFVRDDLIRLDYRNISV
jgi:hypothetical protein